MSRIRQRERDQAKRLFRSAAGAALLLDIKQNGSSGRNGQQTSNDKSDSTTKTFVPGGDTAAAVQFTKEQKDLIRQMVARAKNPAELDEIESSVQRGVFPSHLLPSEGSNDESGPKRKRDSEETSRTERKKAKPEQ